MNKLVLNKDLLYNLYIVQGFSQKSIADKLGCCIDTVARNLKEYNIPMHIAGYHKCVSKVSLNTEQLEYLNGALLGDGCLYMGKHNKNANFLYVSKSLQHVEFATKPFIIYSTKGIKYSEYFDCRTNKIYSHYTYKSICDPAFTDEYNRWYINNVKHIPSDLILTPTICLLWYLGDGCLCHGNRSNDLKLATHCFSYESQRDILIPQLSDFNARLCVVGTDKCGKNVYAIYIPHKSIEKFLDYIGDCPFSDYQYKWDVRKYINSIPKDYTNYEQDICNMYKSGVGYYAIAKHFNMNASAVRYYLIKNNLYVSNYL